MFLSLLILVMLVIQERAVCAVCVLEVDEEKRKELMLQGVPEHCCQSYLWEQSVRDNVTDNKISEQVILMTSNTSFLFFFPNLFH